jgi:hypothetical protein
MKGSKKFGDLLSKYSGGKRTIEQTTSVIDHSDSQFPDQFVGYVILKLSAGLMLDINELLIQEWLGKGLKLDNVEGKLDIRLQSYSSTIMIHFATIQPIQKVFEYFRSNPMLQLVGESNKICQLYLHKIYLYHKPDILDELNTPSHQLTHLPVQKKAIVISRYKETIRWIPTHWYENIYFYNKDENTEASTILQSYLATKHAHQFTQLTNVGRESHTYLTFIIDHYDNLPQITYFTQGNPFDHCPEFVRLVEANVGIVQGFNMLGKRILTIKHGDVSEYETNFPRIQAGFDRTLKHLFGEERLVETTTETSTDHRRNTPPHYIQFTPGAIFAVQRETILQRSRAFYQHALTLVDYDKNPIEGHSFERLWKLIFSTY